MSNLNDEKQAAAVRFLVEFRSRLMASLIVLFSLFAVLIYFANDLYDLLALPLLTFLPQGHLIATQMVSPFFVPMKLAFMVALIIALPYFLYQIWRFVAPALYGHEKRWIWPFLIMSTVLFYAGMAFAYGVIFPMLFRFLSQVSPHGVTFSPDITDYLNFTIKLLFVFGALFEIPMVMVVLVATNLISYLRLKTMRSYAIVGAFIIGMLFAPPDVLSQILLAIPVWLLYEAGLFMTRFVRTEHG